MFDSDSDEFEGFTTRSSTPFEPDEGASVLHSFQPIGDTSAVQTTFGQSFGFANQPPGSLAKSSRLPVGAISNESRVPIGGLDGESSMDSGEWTVAAVGGIPFRQSNKNMAPNYSSTTFGSMPFGRTDVSSSSAWKNARPTFGYASNAGGNSEHFNTGSSRLRDNEMSNFGGDSTTFEGNGNAFGGGQTSFFGASASNREQGSFLQESRGFESGNARTPIPLSSEVTAFGSRASGTNGRKKRVTFDTAAFAPVDNPFVATTSGGAAANAPGVHTTFGAAVGNNNSKASSAFRKSSVGGDAAHTTTFGGVSEIRRQPTPRFGSETVAGGISDSVTMSSMETRMHGTRRAPSDHSKRFQDFDVAEQDITFFGEELLASSHSQKHPSSRDTLRTPKAPKVSQIKKHRKHRQARPRKRVPSISDDGCVSDPVVDTSPSSWDENSKSQLSAAKNLDGLCADMCSPEERELHIRVDELSVFEKCFPGRPGNERDMVIKRFQRSSADHKLDIPEEIRPPGVLRRTQLYIEQKIMDQDRCGLDPRFPLPRASEPIEIYNFCWDRFRMIRKDFILQNYRGAGGRVHPIALDVHERIARYHVFSEHELIEIPSFVAQQNMEQLGQTLKSLNELYDESHKVGDPAYLSPFEAECRAYFILCTLDNGRGMDVLKYVKDLPYHVVQSSHIKFAMRVFVARHTGDYFQFFLLLRQATYLQSCLLFRYIPNVRSSALLRMNRAFRGQTYPLEDLMDLLCFDDIEHAYAVCREHQLKISGRFGIDDDSVFMVKFGDDFKTDAQLRRNNTPLKIRNCKIFISMKQGNYLRRDICRGVTEYGPDKYPSLSKLIQETEEEERYRLYPDRPVVEDPYSYFFDYSEIDPITPPKQPQTEFAGSYFEEERIDDDFDTHDLGTITQRQLNLELEKQAMLERMRKLEQVKEEKTQRDLAKNAAAAEEAAQREILRKQDMIARTKAENEAAEAKRKQQELEIQLHEHKNQLKRAEEAVREANRQRLAAIQEAEAVKIKAAEEERRRQEERQQEIRRREAKKLKRRRQRELAETQARQAREAALEAQRQAQLAEERAETKRMRRAEKQRLAVLKLRLRLWKKYVQVSRHGTGPIRIDATKLWIIRPHQKAKESIQWLFGGVNGISGTWIGTKRLKQLSRAGTDELPLDSDILAVWRSDDILELVSAPLRRQNPGLPSIAWKLVIADLLDGASSSFGLWCAVRAGAQNVAVPEHDCYRTFRSTDGMEQEVAVCSRYLDSTFTERSTHEAQQDKLSATSAILLPVDMSLLQLAGNCSLWEQRVEELLSSLKTGTQVILFALGFASAEMNSSREVLISMLRSCLERVQNRFALLVMQVDIELIDAGDLLPHKFGQVLRKIATLSPPVRQLKSVDLKELLEGSVKAMITQFEPSVGIQRNICAIFPRLREDISTSGVMDLAYPPPELQIAIIEPPRGWNSQEKWHEISTILTALEVTRISNVNSPLNCDQTCDVYFKKIEDFIDRLFVSYPAATAVSTYELKKRIYSVLLPVHERLTQNSKAEQVTPRDADVLLPWRKIFEEIYETFFETLRDITIYYYQGDSCTFGASVSRLLDAAAYSSVPKQPSSKRKRAVDPQSVHVSAQSIRRSFGSCIGLDTPTQRYQIMGEMKRLRVAIDRERAATSEFQQMLHEALNRWDK